MDSEVTGLRNVSEVRSKWPLRAVLSFELLTMDLAAIVVGQTLASQIYHNSLTMPGWQVGLIIAPLFLAFAGGKNVYGSEALSSARNTIPRALTCLFLAVVAFTFIAYFVHFGEEVSRLGFALGLLLTAGGLVLSRIVIKSLQRMHLGEYLSNELLIIDDAAISHNADRLVLRASDLGLYPDLDDPLVPRLFGQIVREFDRVVVSCSPEQRTAWTLLLRASNVEGEIVVPEVDATGILAIGRIDGHFTHVVATGPLSIGNRIRKRMLDLVLVVPAIIGLAPLIAFVALAIKIDSRGPVLFTQERVGRNNQLFKIYKFRSMQSEKADANGNRSASRDDERITRVGRIIRSISIDELPQLFNVLLGEMSLVGPRPHALGSLAGNQLFWKVDNNYWLRHSLKPGITGLAQVRGYRGATNDKSDLTNRLRADLEYIENWSLFYELEILARTALVIMHRNAY